MDKGIKCFVFMQCFCLLLLLCACGKTTGTYEQQSNHSSDMENQDKEDGAEGEAKQEETEKEGTNKESVKAEHLDSLLGEWNLLVSMGEDYYQITDDIAFGGSLDIYRR